ncbi:hypothetical protein BN1708_019389, partial [Verticillium longisporum]
QQGRRGARAHLRTLQHGRRDLLRHAQQVGRHVGRGAVRDAAVAPGHAADDDADDQPAHGQHQRDVRRHGGAALQRGDAVRVQRVQLRERLGRRPRTVAQACRARRHGPGAVGRAPRPREELPGQDGVEGGRP